MKKKVVAMFLAAVMALSLVACGSKSDNGGSGDASGTETIKLGGVGPLTGGYANYGLSVQHGAELAVKEINAAGGVNGKQLELSFQDSQGDPESAVAAYGKLMDWGMNVSLGAVLSGETASVVAAAKADDVLVMETTGSADKCIDGNDKAFRICFYDSYQGTAAADYLTDNALATEVGVFYQSDNDYSAGLYNAFAAQCQKVGVTIKELKANVIPSSLPDVTAAVVNGNYALDFGLKTEEAIYKDSVLDEEQYWNLIAARTADLKDPTKVDVYKKVVAAFQSDATEKVFHDDFGGYFIKVGWDQDLFSEAQ